VTSGPGATSPGRRVLASAAALAALVLASSPTPGADLQPGAAPAGRGGAETLTGRVHRLGAGRGEGSLGWRLERDDAAGVWRSWYRAPGGDVVAEDEVVFEQGTLKRYRHHRPPIGETASVERRGSELVYTLARGGERWERRRRVEEPYAVGPTVVDHVLRHWPALARGEPLTVQYGVLDQMRSFEFRLVRDRGHPLNSAETAVVKMTASSAFVRLFVSPGYIVLSQDGRRFRGLIGRLVPILMEDGKPRPVDGELVVDGPR